MIFHKIIRCQSCAYSFSYSKGRAMASMMAFFGTLRKLVFCSRPVISIEDLSFEVHFQPSHTGTVQSLPKVKFCPTLSV